MPQTLGRYAAHPNVLYRIRKREDEDYGIYIERERAGWKNEI